MSREKWEWWEYPALPLAVVVVVLSTVLPWFRSHGLLKFFTVFMVGWILLAVLAVTTDGQAGALEVNHTWEERGSDRMLITFSCRPARSAHRADGIPGYLFIYSNNCSTYLVKLMFESVGLDRPAAWVDRQSSYIVWDYHYAGKFGVAHLYLGLLTFVSIFVFPLWVALAAVYQLLHYLHTR